MRKITKDLIDRVAKGFIGYVGEWGTEFHGDEHDRPILQVVAERNAKEKIPEVCHSHDFCDANEAMNSALQDCGFNVSKEFEEADAAMLANAKETGKVDVPSVGIYVLWNAAWDRAKAVGFDASKLA